MPVRLGPDPRVATHTALSLLLLWGGRNETSIRHSQDAVALAEGLGHPSSLGYALFHAALLRLWRDEPDEARQLAVRCVEYAQEHGLRIWAAVGTVITGAAATELGLAEEGVRWIEEGLDRYRGLRTPPIFWPFLLRIRATALARAGRIEDAFAAITEAIALSPRDPNLHVVHGDLLLSSGRPADALAAYEGAAQGAALWGASLIELRAIVRAFRADPSEARRARVRDALAGFTEGLDVPELVAAHGIASEGADATG
jgi:tetratricopeptide (TPR) repeat protein